MQNERRKELKELYKQMKPEMGIIIIRSKAENKCCIKASADLKSAMNSTARKLDVPCYPNKELQKAWTEQGANAFTIEILDRLEYSTDDSKSDYSEDLELLEEIWKEKLAAQGMTFYKK